MTKRRLIPASDRIESTYTIGTKTVYSEKTNQAEVFSKFFLKKIHVQLKAKTPACNTQMRKESNCRQQQIRI